MERSAKKRDEKIETMNWTDPFSPSMCKTMFANWRKERRRTRQQEWKRTSLKNEQRGRGKKAHAV